MCNKSWCLLDKIFPARQSLDIAALSAVLLFVMLSAACTPAAAEDVIVSTAAVETSTATALVTEAQLSSALGDIGTYASTDTASVTLPYVGTTDVSSVIKKMRFGTEFDTKGRNWALAYMNIKTPLDDWTENMASLSAGFAYRTNDRIGALMVGPVGHVNNAVSKLSNGKYSIPSLDIVVGVQMCYQAAANPEFVGTFGLAYGF